MDGSECGPCGIDLFALRVSVWQDFGDCSSLYDPKCNHFRRQLRSCTSLGSPNPPYSTKAKFEESCSDAQKLGRLNLLPKGLYLAKWRKGYRYS
jgi:hypothetical protein